MYRRYFQFIIKKFLCIVALLLIVDYFGVVKHAFELDFETFHYPMHGNVVEYANNLRFGNRVDVTPINNYNYTFLYKSANKCSSKDKQSAPHLVILIKSAVNHFERRDVIRRTWGNVAEYPEVLRMVFLLGSGNNKHYDQLIENEYQRFNDIVKSDFIDSYYNNTIKTLMGFRWAVDFCAESSYYMFVDDDYYVSIKNVLRFIKNPNIYPRSLPAEELDSKRNDKFQNSVHINVSSALKSIQMPISLKEKQNTTQNDLKLFSGFVFRSSPHRHKPSKWYISLSDYPFDMWPPYVTAGAYVLSREALFQMYFVSMFTKHFKFDDVYLGILALKANIVLTHCPEFYFQKAKFSAPVDYMHVIASHGYDDHNELAKTWYECNSTGYA